MDCPECGRNVSFTHPWVANTGFGSDSLMRDYDSALFTRHNTAQGQPCTVTNNAFGTPIKRSN